MKPKAAYAEIEILRAKLDSIFFKMQETEPPKHYETNPDWRRYSDAMNYLDRASTSMLAALDGLRGCKAWEPAKAFDPLNDYPEHGNEP